MATDDDVSPSTAEDPPPPVEDEESSPEVGEPAPSVESSVRPYAVVLDTNIHDKGNFNESKVKGLAERLANRLIQLWVPQQVIWEWSAHLAEELEKFSPTLLRTARKSGLPGVVAAADALPTSASAIVESLTSVLREISNVVIIPEAPASASAALRDQILLTGSGKKEKGVRTGAADSALTRDAVAHIGIDNVESIVFLSDNVDDLRNVLDTIDGAGNVRIVRTERDLFSGTVSLLSSASSYLRKVVTDYLDDQQRALHEEFDMSSESWLTETISDIDISKMSERVDEFGRTYGMEDITGVSLEPFADVIGVTDVASDDNQSTGKNVYASFDLTLDAGLEIEGYTLDNDGAVAMTFAQLSAILTVRCVATIQGGKVVELRQEEPAIATDPSLEFDDELDARDWLVGEICRATGMRVTSKKTGKASRVLPESVEISDRSGKVVETIEFRDVHPDAAVDGIVWSATFADGEESVDCLHDGTARVWAGSDSFDAYPPYSLSRNSLPSQARSAVLATVNRLTDQIQTSRMEDSA